MSDDAEILVELLTDIFGKEKNHGAQDHFGDLIR